MNYIYMCAAMVMLAACAAEDKMDVSVQPPACTGMNPDETCQMRDDE